MAEADRAKSLIAKRGVIKGQITRFSNYLTDANEEQIEYIKNRLEAIEKLFDAFNEVQFEIELLVESETNLSTRESFETEFFEVTGKARTIIKKSENKDKTSNNGTNSENNGSDLELQKFVLPTYAGEYDKWFYFKNTFQSLVNENKKLDGIKRFYRLLECLKGEALNVVKELEITKENYGVAWAMLTERFEDKPSIIQNHLKAIVDLAPIQRQSSSAIREFVDTFNMHFRALKSLGEPVDNWDRILILILSRKLDNLAKSLWEETRVSKFKGVPTITDFTTFLTDRCKGLEAVATKDRYSQNSGTTCGGKNYDKLKCYTNSSRTIICAYCKGQHFIYHCQRLKNLPIAKRWNEIKSLKVCTNCFRSNHFVKDCRSEGCKRCGAKHNTLLHVETRVDNKVFDNATIPQLHAPVQETACMQHDEANGSTSFLHCRTANVSQVLLPTAMVLIGDAWGNYHRVKCLLDTGSQSSFITNKLLRKLKLPATKVNLPIIGVSQASTCIKIKTQANIKSVFNNFSTNVQLLALEKITTNMPSHSFDSSKIIIPQNITLADPTYNKSSEIEILLGANVFFDILCVGQIKLGSGLPILQKTLFGWIIAGELNINSNRFIHSCNLSVNSLNETIEKFWRIEEIEVEQQNKPYTKEERECEQYFTETCSRDTDGKFIVALPCKDNVHQLGDSFETAYKRMLGLEQRFQRNPVIKTKYVDFMREYIDMGHMTKIATGDLNQNSTSEIYYLPHHAVINNSSLTTNLRVVFDGSSKSSSGLSLNDVLKVGPNLQDDLFSILCRFRLHNIIITADIAKMYRMVKVKGYQRDLQRIVWRENANSNLEHYQLNTVTYGTGPASFLATRCLKQIANDLQASQPILSNIVGNDFYVDDLITGASTIEEAVDIGRRLFVHLREYGFTLRKWNSNKREVLNLLFTQGLENISTAASGPQLGYFITDENVSKTLGIFWNSVSDELEHIVNINENNVKITKRVILANIARIFDPLGLLGPITVRAKLILQRLWQLKIAWDESVPIEIATAWREFQTKLPILNSVTVNRQVIGQNPVDLELHGFCDASERASGACIYMKSIGQSGNITVRLFCSKSRVAPLKTISIPKLELVGAIILVRLMKKLTRALGNRNIKTFYWCDSTIVLSWIAEEPSMWKTFVSNRVSEIQQGSDTRAWYHVSSKNNPADIISRGVDPFVIANSKLWWEGPQFLYEHNTYTAPVSNHNIDVPERRNQRPVIFLAFKCDLNILNRYSCLYKLQNVVGWCFRFFNNSAKNTKIKGTKLSIVEREQALMVIIRITQNLEYHNEIQSLKSGKIISKTSKIKSLNPFLDENNLLRVGGRLKNAQITYNRKFPIILPSNNHVTRLIIRQEHLRHLHAGPQAILYSLRQRFWPIQGRRTVRSVLAKCTVCFRAKPPSLQQQMGNLPSSRLTSNRAFTYCGTDFAGPFNIKDGRLRNRAIIKAYMCIFICFSTKAVHIEAVSDLSTESFLNAFKRFISRRGICHHIYSDNGTNYVGASNELKKIDSFLMKVNKDNNFYKFISEHNISWKFIPSKSPHQGGIWEAAIKSAKYHATRIIGNNNLTFEELATVFAQIEAVLNSRPLTEMSHDPNDLEPLTPGHFLVSSPLTSLPESNLREVPSNRLRKYQLLRKLYQHFWDRWSNEYLSGLQRRSKWQQSTRNLQVGDLVILREDNLPPLVWRTGRVAALHPGNDNLVRVVSVKTTQGIVKRAVQKVCLFPISED